MEERKAEHQDGVTETITRDLITSDDWIRVTRDFHLVGNAVVVAAYHLQNRGVRILGVSVSRPRFTVTVRSGLDHAPKHLPCGSVDEALTVAAKELAKWAQDPQAYAVQTGA